MVTNRVETLNALMDAAADAAGSGDFATALNKAYAAQAILAGMPTLARTAGGGSQSVAWDQSGIANFIGSLRKAQGAAIGIQSVPIVNAEPASMDANGTWITGLTQ